MALKEYFLFRAKFIKPAQLPLLNADLSPAQIFLGAITDKPFIVLAKDNEWHIGNVEMIDKDSGSFAVGRTTKTTVEKFDKETGDFVDKIDDSGPYTRVIFDSRIGLIGISKKSKLAPDANAVSRKIKAIFERSETVTNTGVEVRIDYIPDPLSFLQKLRSAHAITKFRATFTGPNPVDADEIFQKPLSVYAKEMGAENGIIEVNGKSLNEETAEKIARSTAATGNTASARVIQKKGGKSVSIHMKGNAASVSVSEDSSTEEVLEHMRLDYERIRK